MVATGLPGWVWNVMPGQARRRWLFSLLECRMAANDRQNSDDAELPFWQRKSLNEMTNSEWESLCDGCGKCCLNKLEEEETDRTYYTDVGCRLLDGQTCR